MIGIVVSQWYWDEITSKMLESALTVAKENSVECEVVKVPGCFEIPLAVKTLLKKDKIDAVVTLGAVVQGKTDHDKIIMYSITDAMTRLSLEFEKPVFLGVNGPRMTKEQGVERIERAAKVMMACIKLLK
jgi:6,7-dimethyl-8-ribityllumazine synthase